MSSLDRLRSLLSQAPPDALLSAEDLSNLSGFALTTVRNSLQRLREGGEVEATQAPSGRWLYQRAPGPTELPGARGEGPSESLEALEPSAADAGASALIAELDLAVRDLWGAEMRYQKALRAVVSRLSTRA